MKIKLIKKAIAMFSLVAVSVATFGMNVAVAQIGVGSDSSATELVKSTSTGSTPIIIKAKWEMRYGWSGEGTALSVGTIDETHYHEDDFNTNGAQILPSGDDNVDTKIKICGVIAHPGLSASPGDFSMSVDLQYPNVKDANQNFCGSLFPTFGLSRLTRNEGLELVCGRSDGTTTTDIYDPTAGIRNQDPGLPVRYDNSDTNSPYTYADICHQLEQQEAFVYCGDVELSYEDPTGPYNVDLNANGPGGLYSHEYNVLTYSPLESFKIDFTTVKYGNVSLMTPTISVDAAGNNVGGDADMNTPDKPTIQGTGNTTLAITVEQDDMGFGTTTVGTDANSNVRYKARMGSLPLWTDLTYYIPYNITTAESTPTSETLDRILQLSDIQKLDFQVYVDNFPSWHTDNTYTGNVYITSEAVMLPICS